MEDLNQAMTTMEQAVKTLPQDHPGPNSTQAEIFCRHTVHVIGLQQHSVEHTVGPSLMASSLNYTKVGLNVAKQEPYAAPLSRKAGQ